MALRQSSARMSKSPKVQCLEDPVKIFWGMAVLVRWGLDSVTRLRSPDRVWRMNRDNRFLQAAALVVLANSLPIASGGLPVKASEERM
jgi:hypothetical protein